MHEISLRIERIHPPFPANFSSIGGANRAVHSVIVTGLVLGVKGDVGQFYRLNPAGGLL